MSQASTLKLSWRAPLLMGLLLACSSAAMAQWQWIDGTGRKVFSDTPPPASIPDKSILRKPGSGMTLHPVKLGLDLQQSSDKRRAEAYERLLMDVIKGRLTHFMRRDELEAAWNWIDPILQAWNTLEDKPRPYPAGSWGPAASSALMARDGLTWFEES